MYTSIVLGSSNRLISRIILQGGPLVSVYKVFECLLQDGFCSKHLHVLPHLI